MPSSSSKPTPRVDPDKHTSIMNKGKAFLELLRSHDEEDDYKPHKTKPRRNVNWVWAAWAIFAMAAVCIFPFTRAFEVRALSCEGNYYYSKSQIYALADVSESGLIGLSSPSAIATRLEENPLIRSADVTKNGNDIRIAIEEEMIVGYTQDGDQVTLITDQNEKIPVNSDALYKTLVHYPLLSSLSDETIESLCEQVRKYPKQLTRQVFDRIAEIQPWAETYDKNMLKLVLKDGNTVFTSLPSLFMMTTYNQVLEHLQGEQVCLILDGENSVVNKVSCSYLYLSPEERAGNREIPKSVIDPNYSSSQSSKEDDKKDENKDSQKKSEDDKKEDSENRDSQASSEESVYTYPYVPELYSGIQTIQTPNGTMQVNVAAINDWEPSAVDNIQYSPSTNLFRAMDSGTVYTYDAASDTFYPI